VVRLMAGNKSNREIADALLISMNTVVRHVSNIFDKVARPTAPRLPRTRTGTASSTDILAGAGERQRRVAELRVLRHEMLLLAEAERDGSWTPRWKRLPGGS
jgi:hypothetical protein